MAKKRKKRRIKFSLGKYRGKTIWKCFNCRKLFECQCAGLTWNPPGPICVPCMKEGWAKADRKVKRKKIAKAKKKKRHKKLRKIKFSLR